VSNAPKLGRGPVIPRGDMGLGMCLACLTMLKQLKPDAAEGKAAQFAIAMAPTILPIPGPGGQIIGMAAVAVGTCWDHLNAGPGEQHKPLLVAGGMP
jgi:hypothetical protein